MPATNQDKPTKKIKSLNTAIDIIEVLQETKGARISEIAELLEVSKSTIHAHLATLEDRDFVVRDGNKYRVGFRFLTIGGFARAQEKLTEIAREEAESLAEETGCTVQLVVEEYGRGIYLYQVRGEQSVKTDTYIGTRSYLHCTASGKAILSQLSSEHVEEIIDTHGLPERTSNTITSRDALFEELDQIRERGYALDESERIDGIRCVAAPITRNNGVYGALSISGPSKTVQGDLFRQQYPELIQQSARAVEINYNFS